ncbi:MAG: hypothetical protein KatS3mg064_1203 [Tepidiforma sp.]|nr:hypothetical protein [Tepidiforma sp.]GIW18046.1 MAG: hypothetical protein KatS3mg064_1203 [Tepidiforma sp.]
MPRRLLLPFVAALLVVTALARAPEAGRAAATVTWTGAGTNGLWSNPANWSPSLPSPGDTLVFPPVTGQLSPSNDLGTGPYAAIQVTGAGYTFLGGQADVTGQLSVSAPGTVQVAAPIGGPGGIQLAAGTLRITAAQLFAGAVQVAGGTLIAEHGAALGTAAAGTSVTGGGALRLGFGVDLGPEPVTIAGTGPSGAGALQAPWGAAALGDLTLAADARVAVANGTLLVGALSGPPTAALELVGGGKLEIDGGTFAGIAVAAQGNLTWDAPAAPAAARAGRDGLLRGTGVLGSLAVTGGTAWPGSGPAIGTLAVAGPADFSGGTLRIDIAGTAPGIGYSRLTAGSLSLAGTLLDLRLAPGYAPEPGDTFTIVQVGAGPVAGTFRDLPEGATFARAGYRWAVSYRAGDGNDVVLRVVRQLEADLSAAISADPAAYRPGDLLALRLTMANAGPDAAASPRFYASVPPGTSFVRVDAPGHTCVTPPYFANSITCTGGVLEPGTSREIVLVVRVEPGTAGPIRATVAVASNTSDRHTVNDGAALDIPPAAPGTFPYRRVLPGLAADAVPGGEVGGWRLERLEVGG